MPVEYDYEPRYVDIDDVPISQPDNYEIEQKRRALYHAEGSLELDVNNGEVIPAPDRVQAHSSAVMNLATHVLTPSAEDAWDVTLGDMASGGGEIPEYSSRFLDEYLRLVEQLLDTGYGSSGNFSKAVNLRDDNHVHSR